MQRQMLARTALDALLEPVDGGVGVACLDGSFLSSAHSARIYDMKAQVVTTVDT